MKPLTPEQLVRLLRARGWMFHRHGGRHDVYRKAGVAEAIAVPRHARDLTVGVQSHIMRTAGISRDEL